jgi:tetratricopeptide (TPR) repeat protein
MLRGAFVFAAVLAAAAPPTFAQSLVRGTVQDEKEQPIEGALITFEATEFVNNRETKTDRKGEFLFLGLPSGEYKITASKGDMGSVQQIVTVTQSRMAPLQFFLRSAVSAAAVAAAAKSPDGLDTLTDGKPAKDPGLGALQEAAATAVAAYQAGRFEESAAGLSVLVTKLPNCADCYIYLGRSYAELNRLDEAEAALKKSIEVRPTVEGYTALTRFYTFQKMPELALEMSQKATELASAETAPAAAATAPAAGGGAAPAADGAAAAAPAPPAPPPSASSETLYNQGVVLWNAGKYPEARVQFEAAVKANPDNADAHYQLGMVHLNLGQIPDARRAFEGYLKAAPDGPKAAEVKGFLAQLPK